MSTTYMLQIKRRNGKRLNKKTKKERALHYPTTLLSMSSNCTTKVYKNLVRSYFRNRFLYLINSVKSFEIR